MFCAGFLHDTDTPLPCIPTSLLGSHSLVQRCLFFFLSSDCNIILPLPFPVTPFFLPFPVLGELAEPSRWQVGGSTILHVNCWAGRSHRQEWPPRSAGCRPFQTLVPPAHQHVSSWISGPKGGKKPRLCRVGFRDCRFWGLETQQVDGDHGVPSLERHVVKSGQTPFVRKGDKGEKGPPSPRPSHRIAPYLPPNPGDVEGPFLSAVLP